MYRVSSCVRLLVAIGLVGIGASSCSSDTAGCSSDDDCPQNGECREGVCVVLCSDDSDCTLRDQSCVDGACTTVEDPECAEATATTCSDDNPCTEGDRCTASGACVGEPVSCDDPPEPECVETDTIYRAYAADGSCDAITGDCEYDPIDTACADCATACLLPCQALACDDTHDGCRSGDCLPGPPATCDFTNTANGTICTIETTGQTGTCQGGDCVCTPSCAGRECGDDGCGGTCGTCDGGEDCRTVDGQCVTGCEADCSGRQCGDDNCGGSCGTCAAADCMVCSVNSCVSECGGSEVCVGGSCCTASCPDCRTTTVSDGCGGTCAANCATPSVCDGNVCCAPSCPDCNTSTVSDGCGGSCPPNCSSPSVCDGDSCCLPSCPVCLEADASDGCGGTCSANCTGTDQCCGDTCTPEPSACASGLTDCDWDNCNGCEFLYDDDPTCPTETLTSLCGDTDPPETRTTWGFTEAWIVVPVEECNNLGVGPVVTFTLTMDDCADFDFYVYEDDCSGAEEVHCTGSDTEERKCVGWSDIIAIDNGRTFVVEVVAFWETSICCGTWDLTVTGNTCWTATGGCTPD